jgi:multiple antibiotic resistance protein
VSLGSQAGISRCPILRNRARHAKGNIVQHFAQKFLLAFIPLFVAIDPVGLIALFMGLGTNASSENRKRQAFLGIFTGLCVAVGFIFLGKIIFAALGITVADFQVAGGLILLCLAVRELVGFGPQDRGSGDDFGVVPLGMPLIAGPALLTALLILIDSVGLVFTLMSLLVNLALVAIALCNADRFARLMGRQGLRGVSKLIALLLAAIAISLIRRGWQTA